MLQYGLLVRGKIPLKPHKISPDKQPQTLLLTFHSVTEQTAVKSFAPQVRLSICDQQEVCPIRHSLPVRIGSVVSVR